MPILTIQRPISFQWIILFSLVFFSFFPIFMLEVFQIATLPQNVEHDQIERSKGEIKFAAELMRSLIFDDDNNLALLAENYYIRQMLINNGSELYYNNVKDAILHFVNNTSKISTLDVDQNVNHVLEVGIDLIENITPNSTDYSNDQLKRIITLYYNYQTRELIAQGEEDILEEQNYYPYTQMKSFFPNKIRYTSSIRQRTNFMTGEAILDNNNEPIPVNIHARVIQDENSNYIGLIYSICSAIPILSVIDDLNDPDKPAILTNRAGTVFYSNETIAFIEVTGYYKSILNTGFETTTVDRRGYEGEITIYRQIAVDIEQNQTILIAKVLPRTVIFRIFQDAIWQALLTLIISICLATLLAFITTRLLTTRIEQISQAADQISRGDFAVELDLNGSDEIAKLSRSFHRMTKSLKIFMEKKEEE